MVADEDAVTASSGIWVEVVTTSVADEVAWRR